MTLTFGQAAACRKSVWFEKSSILWKNYFILSIAFISFVFMSNIFICNLFKSNVSSLSTSNVFISIVGVPYLLNYNLKFLPEIITEKDESLNKTTILFASGRWIVRRGSDVNAVNHWGELPIHCAVEHNDDDNVEVISYLVMSLSLSSFTRFTENLIHRWKKLTNKMSHSPSSNWSIF